MKRMKRDKLDSLLNRAAGPAPFAAAPTTPVPSTSQPPAEGLIDRLLRRPMVNLDTPEAQRFLAGKRVLVTGAGGSIGSEICRQTLKFCPARIILLDRCEHALFEINRELSERWLGAEILPLVADICDEKRINQIFQSIHPQ